MAEPDQEGSGGGGDDGGGDADDVASVRQGMDAMKAQLCDSRKASVKALYETQSIWFNCVNQDLIALCKMLASLKADPMNQEMMRGAYALAVSAVTQMRLCNDTMGTFLGPADAGPLTEEEQKKVLADLESSVALPVEKVLGVASSNETTELQNLMDLQAEAAAAAAPRALLLPQEFQTPARHHHWTPLRSVPGEEERVRLLR